MKTNEVKQKAKSLGINIGKMKKAEIVQWVNNVLESNITDHNEADAIILALAGAIA